MVSARAGLATVSARIVSPDGTDLYSESVNDEPRTKSMGTATMSPTDHMPNDVLGEMRQGRFVKLSLPCSIILQYQPMMH